MQPPKRVAAPNMVIHDKNSVDVEYLKDQADAPRIPSPPSQAETLVRDNLFSTVNTRDVCLYGADGYEKCWSGTIR
jgi:hypothetical protein